MVIERSGRFLSSKCLSSTGGRNEMKCSSTFRSGPDVIKLFYAQLS